MRVRIVKSILWFFVGLAATAIVFRLLKGLGAVTALTDTTPWGLWIGFDVLGGVALAAGGFVMAACVYIFHLEKYRPIVRPAVLTAFLGYVAVAGGLLLDIGIPWNIWRPMFFWQHHSALFEVAWCVMLYLNVLFLEFAPVVFERLPFTRTYKILKALTIPLVILGIMLSTLHQSSLGTLFLIMPFRLHPLWYSPILPILFFISAIGLGLSMVIAESIVSSWLYKKEIEKDLLGGLAKAASYVLGLYAIIKLGDLAAGGKLSQMVSGSWEGNLFIFELLVSAIIPASLFAIPKVRQSVGGLATGAGLAIFGFVLNRIGVSGLSTISATGTSYFPSWIEFAISTGIISAAALAFFFFIENFSVYETQRGMAPEKYEPPTMDVVTGVSLDWSSLAGARQYSLIFIFGAALSFSLMPIGSTDSAMLEKTPVKGARSVEGLRSKMPEESLYAYALFDGNIHNNPADGEKVEMLLIDGDRQNRLVLFDHEEHKRQNGEKESCGLCHHMNKPLDRATSCSECHRDMFLDSDIFDHEYHREKLESLESLDSPEVCASCHKDPSQSKNRRTTTPCDECHKSMRATESFVKAPKEERNGMAPGYMDAMHSLCVECHKEKQIEKAALAPDLARCGACHQGVETSMLYVMEPYPQQDSPVT